MIEFVRVCTLMVVLSVAVGCGAKKPKLVEVTGKVLQNGQPVTAGSIWFHPDVGNPWTGEKSSCLLQLDGSFAMRTYPYGDGVPPGKYKVTLLPELANRLRLPNLSNPEKTTLSIDVPETGIRDRVFELPQS